MRNVATERNYLHGETRTGLGDRWRHAEPRCQFEALGGASRSRDL